MKKLTILILIVLSLLLASCDKNKTQVYSDTLPDDLKETILTLKNTTLSESQILYFYGGFDDAYAVFTDPARQGSKTHTVAGCTFTYPSNLNMDIYYDNRFYSLEEAYDNKILTKESVSKIKENFDKAENLGLRGELLQQGLTKDYYQEIIKVIPYYAVTKYLGTYNNSHVVWYASIRPNITLVEYREVSGYVYDYHNYSGIKVINEEMAYELQDAYDKNLLNDDNLKDITIKFYGVSPDEIQILKDSNGKEYLSMQSQYNIAWAYNNKYEFNDPLQVIGNIDGNKYLGTHNGYIVTTVRYFKDGERVIKNIELAGCAFTIWEGEEEIAVYKEEGVYSLQEAYDNKLLTDEDIQNIFNYLTK